jgi:uncharacterized protein (TIGR02001 family)
MMKFTKLSLVAILATTTFTTVNLSANEDISVSANMALTSNYIWRGMTQSDDAPAIQGGVDFGYRGFYLGTWASNISWTNDNDSSLELDIYAGYSAEVLGVSYDIGYIRYAYPKVQDANNFDEAYISLSKDFDLVSLSAKYSKQVDGPTGYKKIRDIEGTISTKLPQSIGLDITYGDYEDVGDRYLVGLSRSFGKFDLTLAYSDFSHESDSSKDEDSVIATISTSF